MADVPAVIFDDPVLVALLAVVLRAGIAWQRGLTYREVIVLESAKRNIARTLERLLPITLPLLGWTIPSPAQAGRALTREAHVADHVTTVDASPREIVRAIRPPFQPNLFSTSKYRVANDSVEWAHTQWAIYYDHDGDPWKTHIYFFVVGPETAVYAHTEPSEATPEAHTRGGEQLPGDAHGKFAEVYND